MKLGRSNSANQSGGRRSGNKVITISKATWEYRMNTINDRRSSALEELVMKSVLSTEKMHIAPCQRIFDICKDVIKAPYLLEYHPNRTQA